MFHFYNTLEGEKNFFYINWGVLIYLFSTTSLFMLGRLFAQLDVREVFNIWFVNAVMYLIYQIFIFIEWKNIYFRRKQSV